MSDGDAGMDGGYNGTVSTFRGSETRLAVQLVKSNIKDYDYSAGDGGGDGSGSTNVR